MANVYLGQLRGQTPIRGETSSFDETWKRYGDLQSRSANASAGIKRDELQRLYDQLPTEQDTIDTDIVAELLQRLAELISQRAARQAVLKAISEMCAEIGPSFDLASGMATILRKVSRILRFSSGSIFLVEEIGDENYLRPISPAFLYPEGLEMLLRVDSPEGVAPRIYRERRTIRFGTRSEMDDFAPSAVPESRNVRRIKSFLGSPLEVDGEVVGVIEVGLDQEKAYTKDDESLIFAVAQYAARYWKSSREHRTLVSIIGEKDLDTRLNAMVKHIPELVHGRFCSIFLRDMSRWGIHLTAANDPNLQNQSSEFRSLPAFLRATSEFPVVGEKFYNPNEGLTGWVLATGKPLLIKGGPGARTVNLSKIDSSLKWKGKYQHEDVTKPVKYYENRPFLAVPIRVHGSILGVIRIPDSIRDDFSAEDQDVLERFAAAISTAIEATSLVVGMQNITEAVRKLKQVLVVTRTTASRTALSPQTVSRLILSRLLAFFGAISFFVFIGEITTGARLAFVLASLAGSLLAGVLSAFWWKVKT